MTGLYQHGIFGEDESDEFTKAVRKSAEQQPVAGTNASVETSASTDAEDFLAKATVLDLIKEAETLEELGGIWTGEAKPWRKDADVFAAKEARKNQLQTASV